VDEQPGALVVLYGVRHGRHELLQPVWMHGGPPSRDGHHR
jgi:hypothetical protein